MDLLVSSFVRHSSLLTAKGVDLVVARKTVRIFHSGIMIAEVLFKQFLICTAL